jgi:flagellin
MPLVINTNVSSLEAQKSLNKSQQTLMRSFQRLSSGFRINTASDDAAGMAVSENLRSRIASFKVAERNTNTAVSMTVTAEGGLGEISSVVTRMRELAVQSANGDLTSTDRGYLDTEFQLLSSEIDRLSASTQYASTALLSGTSVTISFQVGINTTTNDVIAVNFGGVSVSALGLCNLGVGGSVATSAQSAINSLDSALTIVSTYRARFGAATNRLNIAIQNSQTIRNNLEAANSAIRDVDVAGETSVLARAQVLLQAGTSVLAQANQQPNLSLALLR